MDLSIQPFVQHIRDELWRIRGRGLASVMVGAGFSRNAEPAFAGARQFPLWDELARSMAEGIGLDKDRKPRDPLQIAQMYAATLGRAELHRLIERHIPDSERRPGDLHRRLLSLPWADVFTTNYDTLLERTCAEVYNQHYERVLTSTDIPMRQPARLVKLHGTLGSGGPLIATQEDYRRYPQTHAPFVNLVRQSVMETVFVLIGFAGDDPNFLEWTGWVRDAFGDDAPKIYLCGLLDSSPAMRALLDSRRVTPVDLSEVVIGCDGEERHGRALDWFIAALEAGKPGRAIKWAPRKATIVPEKNPPLPPARIFTAFSEYPEPVPGGGIDLQKIRAAAVTWSLQRKEYPGWHLPPDSVSERLWQTTHRWRTIVFVAAEKLSEIERLLVVYELCWRLELCLSPIFTHETDKLVGWLEAINPFGLALDMPKAIQAENGGLELQHAWITLALHVLRTARDDLDEQRYSIWRSRLLAIAGADQTILGELHYEELLRHLNRLDLGAFRFALATWRASAKQPLELARLAALYAELGDKKTASDLGLTAINELRADGRNPAAVSLESWCCLMLDNLDWQDTPKSAQWRERIELAKEQRYDPWETIKALRHELKAPRPQWAKRFERKAGFDAGDIQQTVHFRSEDVPVMPAFRLLRLIEKAPCPLYAGEMELLGTLAARAAMWVGDAAPFWSVATLLRAGAGKEVLDELFDRATIAMLNRARVEQLHAQLLRMIFGEIAVLSVAGGGNAIGMRTLRTGIDVLSRIALRLTAQELEALLAQIVGWLVASAVMARYELADQMKSLLKRVLEALPDDSIPRAVELMLPLPIYGEPDYRPMAHDQTWPEPFEMLLVSHRKFSPPSTKPSNWGAVWPRLLQGINSDDVALRRRALIRVFYLHLNLWLNEDEQSALAAALWSHRNQATGLPEFNGFRRSVVLYLPKTPDHDARKLLKLSLLSKEFRPWSDEPGGFNSEHLQTFGTWMNEIAWIFRHPAIARPEEAVLSLEADEATDLLTRLFSWWPTAIQFLTDPKFRHLPMGVFDTEPAIQSFCEALGDSLLLRLPRGHELAVKAEQFFDQLISSGVCVARATPGRLFHRPELLGSIAGRMEATLLSSDDRQLRSTAEAVSSWNKTVQASLAPAVPSSLIDLLIARIMLQKMEALDSVICCIVSLVESANSQIDRLHEHKLVQALDQLASCTSTVRLRERFEAGEIDRANVAEGLHIRGWAGLLASRMAASYSKRGEALPDVLNRWRKICEDDTLPETRRAWAVMD